jgi:hypothetical protein
MPPGDEERYQETPLYALGTKQTPSQHHPSNSRLSFLRGAIAPAPHRAGKITPGGPKKNLKKKKKKKNTV